jgi:hypothetical protein
MMSGSIMMAIMTLLFSIVSMNGVHGGHADMSMIMHQLESQYGIKLGDVDNCLNITAAPKFTFPLDLVFMAMPICPHSFLI